MTADIATSRTTSRSWLLRPTTLAGFGFTLSWLIGLSVLSASTAVVSTGAQIIAAYSGQAVGGVLQYLFTEGLPPVAILIVVGALARSVRDSGHARLGGVIRATAVAASIISFVQFALGVLLVTVAVPASNAPASADLFDAVTRLDGAKMLLFAGMAVATLVALATARRGRPVWLLVTSALLAIAITVSGIGYLLIVPSLASAAVASLPLLLVWVTGFAIVLGRAGH